MPEGALGLEVLDPSCRNVDVEYVDVLEEGRAGEWRAEEGRADDADPFTLFARLFGCCEALEGACLCDARLDDACVWAGALALCAPCFGGPDLCGGSCEEALEWTLRTTFRCRRCMASSRMVLVQVAGGGSRQSELGPVLHSRWRRQRGSCLLNSRGRLRRRLCTTSSVPPSLADQLYAG